MKSRIRLIAIIAGAAVLLAVLTFVIIYAINADRDATVTLTAEKATEFYDAALQGVSSTEDFSLDIHITKNIIANDNLYSRGSHQIVTYKGYGTDDMQVMSQEDMAIGHKTTTISEVFSNNKAYFTVNGVVFACEMTKDAFVGRFIPVAPIDTALYVSVSGTKSRDGVFIEFSEPKGAEQWYLPAGATFLSASGTVQLNADGQLQQSTYIIDYTHGEEQINTVITVGFTPVTDVEITVPTGKKHTALSYPDTAKDLEILYGYLLQSDKIYAQANETINSQASGIQRTQKTVLDMNNAATRLGATIDTNIAIVDYSDGEDTATQTQLETFQNNVYTISTDGGEAVVQADVTAEQMLNYCQDLLVKNVILPENIASVSAAQEGDVLTLQITGTEELAQLICKNACKTLYDDAELLNDLASSYKTNKINCYYKLNKVTGLPLAAGLDYSGEHTIEGFAYTLTYSAEIVYGKPAVNTEATTDETTPTETTPPQ